MEAMIHTSFVQVPEARQLTLAIIHLERSTTLDHVLFKCFSLHAFHIHSNKSFWKGNIAVLPKKNLTFLSSREWTTEKLQIRIKCTVDSSWISCVCYGSIRNIEHATICLTKKLCMNELDNFSFVKPNYLKSDIQRKKMRERVYGKIFYFSQAL